jgi:hypothetical protein
LIRLPPRLYHPQTKRRIDQHPDNRGGHGRRIAARKHHAVALHHFRQASGVRRYHRHARRKRFNHHPRRRLAPRRHHQQIESRERVGRVSNLAEELHTTWPESRGLFLHRARKDSIGTRAGDAESRFWERAEHFVGGGQEVADALVGMDAADGADHRTGRVECPGYDFYRRYTNID